MPALFRPETITIHPSEVGGLPEVIVDGFGAPGPDGAWTVEVDEAVLTSTQDSATDRGLRERAMRAWLRRGLPETRDVLAEAADARREIASLLGRPSWLALRAERMAIGGIEALEAFLDGLEPRLARLAQRELDAQREVLAEETGDPGVVLQEWDWRYVDGRQRARAGSDPDALRAYLPFEACLEALATLGESMFGVRMEPRPERAGWHPDVRAFDLVDRDTGRLVSELFVDPYVREGKGSNAWADVFDPGDDGTFGVPRPRVMTLVTNAPAPVEGAADASTIGLYELDTLFHEYGHVLDYALDASRWWPMRDDWDRFDWVEGPSVFLGTWALRAPVLRSIGRHHATGEPVPEAMLASLETLNGLNAAFKTLRHVSMARVDALVHGAERIPLEEADARAWAVRRLPPVEGANFTATFAHLLGGYDGAVHGFAWDTVLQDDLMAGFEEGGLLAPEVGAAYRRAVLEAPWTGDPLLRVAAFRGRPWSFEPFLRRIGS
jgi:Zn-dependent oligopeptidase